MLTLDARFENQTGHLIKIDEYYASVKYRASSNKVHLRAALIGHFSDKKDHVVKINKYQVSILINYDRFKWLMKM